MKLCAEVRAFRASLTSLAYIPLVEFVSDRNWFSSPSARAQNLLFWGVPALNPEPQIVNPNPQALTGNS